MPCEMMRNCGFDASNKIKNEACVCSGSWWIHKNAFLCLKVWKFLQRKQRWTRNVKNWVNFRRGTWRKSENKNEVIDEARTKGAKVHFASIGGHMSFEKNDELEAKHQKYKRSSCIPRWYCKKTIQDLMQYSLSMDLQHHKLHRQKSWITFPDYQVAMDKQQTQYRLIPK